MMEYKLKLPLQRRLFDDTTLTFTINHIRSRRPSVMYFKFHCYGIECEKDINPETGEFIYTDEIYLDGTENPVYTSPRTVIGTAYGNEPSYTHQFDIPDVIEDTVYCMVEIIFLGIDSENPLYFNQLMLQEGEFDGYHDPMDMSMSSHSIELLDSLYANLYDSEGNYLQVIRPNKETFHTDKLDGAKYTVLAPHFAEENEEVDGHVAVYMEAMNQTEQRIDVLR